LRQILGRDGRLMPVDFGSSSWKSLRPDPANRCYHELEGKTVRQARRVIVELLREAAGTSPDGGSLLVGEPQAIEHSVKFYEKGEHPLEFIATRQWFVRLLDKKERLLEFGDRIHWYPDFMRHRYRTWTENLAFDWAISRQRHFGVPFPLWYPVLENGKADFRNPIIANEDLCPVDPVTATPPGFDESQRNRPRGFMGETDVFDTWFTSSLSPQIVAGWMTDRERFARLFPMDLRPQSHEIIRTWAFYTIAKAMLHEDTIPWRNIAISGWILDPDRKKMSKSRGNVVTPMHLLDEYGSDAVRYWAASARLGVDTALDVAVMKVGRRLVTKLFNASKFVLGQKAPPGPITHEMDRVFLGRLRELVVRSTEAMESYSHEMALSDIERFFWTSFTDSFIEIARTRARGEAGEAAQISAVASLRLGLSVLLRLFAPFLPFITEEAWSWTFAEETGHPSIHRAPWPSDTDFTNVAPVEDLGLFEIAVMGLSAINRARAEASVATSREIYSIILAAPPPEVARLTRVSEDIRMAARGRSISVVSDPTVNDNALKIRHIEFAEDVGRSGQ